MVHHAIGEAIQIDKIISLIKSFESILMISKKAAPKTLRIPISLTRCSPVIARLVQHEQHDHKKTCRADGQPDRIQDRESLVLPEASPGSFEIVFYHKVIFSDRKRERNRFDSFRSTR